MYRNTRFVEPDLALDGLLDEDKYCADAVDHNVESPCSGMCCLLVLSLVFPFS